MESLSATDWAICIICVLFLGIAKAGFAGGIGVIATPLMTLVMPASQAIGILLPLLMACDAFSLYAYRGVYSRANLWSLLPGAAVGVTIGGGVLLVLQYTDLDIDRTLEVIIGAVSMLFVLYQSARRWLLPRLEKYHPKRWHGWLLGGASGLTSTLAHAGGPPVTMYLLPQHLDRGLFVGTTVWLFAAINLFKLVPYLALGLLTADGLRESSLLLPVAPVGVGLGVWLNRRVGDSWFNGIVYVLLMLTGIHLLFGWDPISWAFRPA